MAGCRRRRCLTFDLLDADASSAARTMKARAGDDPISLLSNGSFLCLFDCLSSFHFAWAAGRTRLIAARATV